MEREGPKKPLNAFVLFIKERKETLTKENPEIHSLEMIKIIANEWKELSDEKKKPYYERAEADKKRYEAEIAAFDSGKNFEE